MPLKRPKICGGPPKGIRSLGGGPPRPLLDRSINRPRRSSALHRSQDPCGSERASGACAGHRACAGAAPIGRARNPGHSCLSRKCAVGNREEAHLVARRVSGGTSSSGAMKKFPASISAPTEPGLSLKPGSHESDQPKIRGRAELHRVRFFERPKSASAELGPPAGASVCRSELAPIPGFMASGS